MSPDSNRLRGLRVFLIFQGPDEHRFGRALQARLGAEPDLVDQGRTRVLLANDAALTGTFFDRLEAEFRECDAAVAMITNDPEPGSRRGNAWFELGLWLGKKRELSEETTTLGLRRSLLVVTERHDNVGLITDLQGRGPVSGFSSEDQLYGLVLPFLHQEKENLDRRLSRQDPDHDEGGYPVRRRVADTFGCTKVWADEGFLPEFDQRNESPEEFRFESFAYIAELLRMARSYHELALIRVRLSRIEALCERIVCKDHFTGDQTEPFSSISVRKHDMSALHAELSILRQIASQKLERSGSATSETSVGLLPDPWERLDRFLRSRSQAVKTSTDPQLQEVSSDAEFTEAQLSGFIAWAKEFSRPQDDQSGRQSYERTALFREGLFDSNGRPRSDSNLEEIEKSAHFARRAAKLLDRLHERCFSLTGAAMRNRLATLSDSSSASGIFRDIRSELLHNTPGSEIPLRIWPEHQGS